VARSFRKIDNDNAAPNFMTPKQLAELKNDPTLRARLAKLMARDCFRNTILEDFHAGTFPSPQSGDYSDVKVISPYGEIQWNRLSRLSDAEMKALMIDVVNHCYDFLIELCSPHGAEIIEDLKQGDKVPGWNEPQPVILRHWPSLR
jgi:hypothetical protein